MRQLNILMFASEFPHIRHRSLCLVEAMKEQGHKIDLFFIWNRKGINPLVFFHYIFRILSVFSKKPDVIIGVDFGSLIATFFAKILKTHLITDIADPNTLLVRRRSKKWMVYFAEKIGCQHADAIVVPGQALKDFISLIFEVPLNKITILSNAVDKSFFNISKYCNENSPSSNNQFIVGYIGHLSLLWGADLILSSIKQLKDYSDIHFWIVGTGPYFSKIEQFVHSSGVTNVRLFGYIRDKKRLTRLISSFDVMLGPYKDIPYEFKGKRYLYSRVSSQKILEAISAGLPLLIPNTEGLKRFSCFSSIKFFEPENPKSLVEQVLLLYKRKGKYEALDSKSSLEMRSWQEVGLMYKKFIIQLITS